MKMKTKEKLVKITFYTVNLVLIVALSIGIYKRMNPKQEVVELQYYQPEKPPELKIKPIVVKKEKNKEQVASKGADEDKSKTKDTKTAEIEKEDSKVKNDEKVVTDTKPEIKKDTMKIVKVDKPKEVKQLNTDKKIEKKELPKKPTTKPSKTDPEPKQDIPESKDVVVEKTPKKNTEKDSNLVPDSENPFKQPLKPLDPDSGLQGEVNLKDISEHVPGTGKKF